MKVFIAGGTGNMGQNLTKKLLDNGHEVVILSRTPERVTGLVGREGVSFVKGDIHSYEAIKEGMRCCATSSARCITPKI